MAVPIGAIIAGVSAVAGLAKDGKSKGKIGRGQGPGAPSLIDPRQQAMINQMQRERRAKLTGTSDVAARNAADKAVKNFMKNKARHGDSTVADIARYRSQIEDSIVRGTAEERTGMLGSIVDESRNVADRALDLQSLEYERGRLKETAKGQTLSKNLTTLGTRMLSSGGSGGGVTDGKKKSGFDWQELLGQAGKKFGGNGGGAGGATGGGGDSSIDWGQAASTIGKAAGRFFGG